MTTVNEVWAERETFMLMSKTDKTKIAAKDLN
jgi:hypothetical protein